MDNVLSHRAIVSALLDSNTTRDNPLYPFNSKMVIKIHVYPSLFGEEDRGYKINKITVHDHFIDNLERTEDSLKSLDESLHEFVIETNLSIKKATNGWNAFYLLKEIIQQVEEFCFAGDPQKPISNKFELFFRGQNHNFPMLPGIAREKSFDVMRLSENFETLYKDLSYEYEELTYVPFKTDEEGFSNPIRDRVTQLALLQHYGFPTSLVDVTSSPFVGMFFMSHPFTRDENYLGESESPTLTIFMARKGIPNSLFQKAEVTQINRRLKPQFGSFIDFEMLAKQNFDVTPVRDHAIHIVFEYDREAHKDAIKKKGSPNKIPSQNTFKYKNMLLQMFRSVREDVELKLAEYHYRYVDLFPELENRSTEIRSIYKNQPNNTKLDI